MKAIQKSHCQQRAFSLIELLMAISTIAVIATLGFMFISPTQDGIKDVKLRSDIETLNESIQVYRGNGGSMEGVTTITGALAKLKMESDYTSAAKVVGIRGSMLDPRITADLMTTSETASSKPRALWSADRKRFVYATSGAAGAKRFFLDHAASSAADAPEARETALSYGTANNWVWDYADVSLAASSGVEGFGTSGSTTGGYTPLPSPTAAPLAPPTFSKDPGLYNYHDFDLAVELINPNPGGVSALYYSVDGALWRVYTGGDVMVEPNQTLVAYAVSMDPDNFVDSSHNEAHYGSSFTISGDASGDFFNAEGPAGMVTNLLGDDRGEYFRFGTAAGTPDPSWLLFNGASFADVGTETSFLLGTLDYYNGTILGGTQAVSVELAIDLAFNGGTQTLQFGYEMDLLSTQNLETNTAEQNADFVRLGDMASSFSIDLGGVSYNLVLEFGETTEGGFSNIDEFHVLEGQAASGNLYGRLVEVTDEEEEG